MNWSLHQQVLSFSSVSQCLPEGIEDSAIAEDSDESVIHSDIVQERPFGIRNEGIRDPKQGYQAPIQAQAFISREYQP